MYLKETSTGNERELKLSCPETREHKIYTSGSYFLERRTCVPSCVAGKSILLMNESFIP